MPDLRERINELIIAKRLTPTAFAKQIGVASSNFSRMMAGEQTITDKTLYKVVGAFGDVSFDWLRDGKGEMLKAAVTNQPNEEEKFYTYLLPVAAIGGELSGFDCDSVMPRDCERVISPVADVDFAMPVIGDSMEPEYPSGARVMVKRVDPGDFIAWGNVYVLDTTNGPLIKEVQPSDKGDAFVLCRSHNPSGRYKPFDVPLASVRAMYRVVACVSLK